jgi:hypothetical protein
MIYIFIFILTLGDLILTGLGIANKRIDEANPIMAKLYEWNIPLTVMIIGVIVGLLIWFSVPFIVLWAMAGAVYSLKAALEIIGVI